MSTGERESYDVLTVRLGQLLRVLTGSADGEQQDALDCISEKMAKISRLESDLYETQQALEGREGRIKEMNIEIGRLFNYISSLEGPHPAHPSDIEDWWRSLAAKPQQGEGESDG